MLSNGVAAAPKTPGVDRGLKQITRSCPHSILKSPERILVGLAAGRVRWKGEPEASADITGQGFTTQYLYTARPAHDGRAGDSSPAHVVYHQSLAPHTFSPPPSLRCLSPSFCVSRPSIWIGSSVWQQPSVAPSPHPHERRKTFPLVATDLHQQLALCYTHYFGFCNLTASSNKRKTFLDISFRRGLSYNTMAASSFKRSCQMVAIDCFVFSLR